ncbi:hypothetical protein [Streptomyces sp. TLI_171]|uniref:hypothetical protein n=1 Tax=Streptomyces sp. TLI_171 TaxID=1938859 RepID=UPI000C4FE4BD|nr:hypothetical protein [Streptomyces sp. TLI_171]RKE21302.1 hypothetical protein BX266_4682 [Streptomyces sp. TLI_171]
MPFVADRTTATATSSAAAVAVPRRRRRAQVDPRAAAALQRALDRRDNGAPAID